MPFGFLSPVTRLKCGSRRGGSNHGLHCLSAFCPLSPRRRLIFSHVTSTWSPLPFGFLSPVTHAAVTGAVQSPDGLHCLSAFCPLSPAKDWQAARSGLLRSPLPFGFLSPVTYSGLCRHLWAGESPLPFGFLSPVTLAPLRPNHHPAELSPLPFGFLSPVTNQ